MSSARTDSMALISLETCGIFNKRKNWNGLCRDTLLFGSSKPYSFPTLFIKRLLAGSMSHFSNHGRKLIVKSGTLPSPLSFCDVPGDLENYLTFSNLPGCKGTIADIRIQVSKNKIIQKSVFMYILYF